MKHVTFLSLITHIFIISFSLILLPMDPPAKIIKSKVEQVNSVKINTVYEAFQCLGITGGIFNNFPDTTLVPVLVVLEPTSKNILRQTNKAFSFLLSRENPQDFMFCRGLCATQQDKFGLGLQMLHSINKESKEKKEKGLNFLYETNFMNYHYTIMEEKDRYIEFSSSALTLVTISENVIRLRENIHPIIFVCLTRNPKIIQSYFTDDNPEWETFLKKRIPRKMPLGFELFLPILVQNDDANSLQLICSTKLYNEYVETFSFKLLQLAIFCASHKVIPILANLYKSSKTKKIVDEFYPIEEVDILGDLFNQPTDIADKPLSSLVKIYHTQLSEKHRNNLSNYHACLQPLLKKKDLQKLEVPASKTEKKSKSMKKHFFW